MSVRFQKWFLFLLTLGFLSGCRGVSPEPPTATVNQSDQKIVFTPLPSATAIPSPTTTVTPVPEENWSIWLSPDLPQAFVKQVSLPENLKTAPSADDSSVQLEVSLSTQPATDTIFASWVYTLVAPFPTVLDGVAKEDVLAAWKGKGGAMDGKPLLLTAETKAVLSKAWGAPAAGGVEVVEEAVLLQRAWDNRPTWAIVPFESLEPRWKILRVDNQSPLDKKFNPDKYPLTIYFGLKGKEETRKKISGLFSQSPAAFPAGNRDETKMTTLVLTGTTALVRHVAFQMEQKGVTYPAEKIRDWFLDADIVHISNEVSFDPDCPPAVPLRLEARFCNDPKYFELLKNIHASIIELTGNHMLDWGREPFLYTLDLYQKNNLPYYGGGRNLEEGRKPLLVENKGNKLAFIGCSPSGPENVWATDTESGSASCDFPWLEGELKLLREQGYLPIFTFQHLEVEDYVPHSSQRIDFQRMSEAGAEIVSGASRIFRRP